MADEDGFVDCDIDLGGWDGDSAVIGGLDCDDDNADINDFMGHFELRSLYKLNDHTVDLLFRNNFKSSRNRGAIELGWSFPIHNKVRGYVQWFNGYGESLIDYDNHTNSIGFGVQLSDWL